MNDVGVVGKVNVLICSCKKNYNDPFPLHTSLTNNWKYKDGHRQGQLLPNESRKHDLVQAILVSAHGLGAMNLKK